MKVICAWCGKVKRKGKGRATHGICAECFKKMEKEAGLIIAKKESSVRLEAA